jgi:hypothetical protein
MEPWRCQMWYVEDFESFKICINFCFNLLSIYFAKAILLTKLQKQIESRLKLQFVDSIHMLHFKGHDLTSWTHEMHFTIIYLLKKLVLNFKFMKKKFVMGFTLL